MRPLLAICFVTVTLAAGCGGGDSSNSADESLSIEDRVLVSGDLSGYDINDSAEVATDPTALFDSPKFFFPASDEEIAKLKGQLEEAGFVSGAFQFLGGATEEAGAAGSIVAQVGSADAAKAMAKHLNDASLAPCEDDCSIDFSTFDVEGIPGAMGSSRMRSEEASSGKNEPVESHHVVFANGPYVYVVYANGRPGGVDSGNVADAARALYERVAQ